MKTIAIILLLLGIALIAAGVLIFFFTDAREAPKELRTTKRIQKDSLLDTAAQEIYYGSVMAYNSAEPPESLPKKRFRRNLPHEAVDDTAVLAGAKSKAAPKVPSFTDSKALSVLEPAENADAKTEPLKMSASDTAPLEKTLTSGREAPVQSKTSVGTSPLVQSTQKKTSATAPLIQDNRKRQQTASATAPLKQERQTVSADERTSHAPWTEPLKKKGTQPLKKEGTAPLKKGGL